MRYLVLMQSRIRQPPPDFLPIVTRHVRSAVTIWREYTHRSGLFKECQNSTAAGTLHSWEPPIITTVAGMTLRGIAIHERELIQEEKVVVFVE